MMNRQILGVGTVFLLVVGCNSQPQASNNQAPLQNKSFTTQAAVTPNWKPLPAPLEAPAPVSAADALTIKAREYANTMSGADPGNSVNGGAASLFTDSPKDSGRKTSPSKIEPSQLREDAAPAATADASSIGRPGSVLSQGENARGTAQITGAPVTAHANAPSDEPRIVPESADWASTGSGPDSLAKKLMKRVRDNPRDISNQLDLQLLGMLNDNQSPELASLSLMPIEDRELISSLIDGLSNFRATVRQDANMLPAQKIKPLTEMAKRLQTLADLNVSTVVLCKRVEGFGKYEPYVPARFPAMKDNWIIVYCEVENFLPKQNAQQMWETNLNEQVTLYTDTGLLVWSDNKQKVTDQCRNRRHDFFAYNKIMLPSSLGVGRYVLKMTIEDENADRVAEASVPLSIGAQ